MDIKQLEQILAVLKENGVTDFELEHDGTHIKLSRAALSAPAATSYTGPYPAAPQPEVSAPAPSQQQEENSGYIKVNSPIVGTFYRKPAPDADVFVKEGDFVSKGDTLCIVEAMKLMNEIEAPGDGKIIKIGLADGQVVEFGETLFIIDPSA